MKKRGLFCIIMLLTIFFSSTLPVYAFDAELAKESIHLSDVKIYSQASASQNFEGNSVIVVLDKSISKPNKIHDKKFFGSFDMKNIIDLTHVNEETLSLYSLEEISNIYNEDFRQILKIQLPSDSKENVLRVIKLLEQVDGIRYAGPNYIWEREETFDQRVSISSETSTMSISSNDVSLTNQWGLKTIDIRNAWNITTGSSNVRVGIIDTGIAPHPDIENNISYDEGKDCSVDADDYTDDDYNGHGTLVSGIIGADGNDGEGIYGVAPNVTLIPIQISNRSDGGARTDAVISAIIYASHQNIPIINLSYGSPYYDEGLKQAIVNYNGLVVCAAGNNGSDIDTTPYYPSCYDLENIISVAAFSPDRTIYSGSNYGKKNVDILAPGDSIYTTTVYIGSNNVPEYGYQYYSYTSTATPFVTGVAALLKSIRPNLTAKEIKSFILDNVDTSQSWAHTCSSGGYLNAYKAVRAATEAETFTGDTNGDGRSDIIMSRNIGGKRAITVYLGKTTGVFSEPITTQSTRNFYYDDPAFVGDFNGDNISDVVIHWDSNGKRQLLVYIGKGDGTFYEGANLSSTRNHNLKLYPSDYFVEDVNGDGKDDFVVHFRNASGNRSALVYKGTASSPYLVDAATYALTSSNKYYDEDPVFMGDFNGDGKADLLVHWQDTVTNTRQLLIYKGNADATFSLGANLDSSITYDPLHIPYKFLVGDVTGDGKDDFIAHYKNSLGNRENAVYRGTSSSPYTLEGINALTSSNDYIPRDPVFVGDVNGDGRDDLIVHWTSSAGKRQLLVYTANSNGTFNSGVNFATTNNNNPLLYSGRFFVADVDGDGREDFIVKWRNGDNIAFLTYKGTSTGTFSAAVRTNLTNAIPYFDE